MKFIKIRQKTRFAPPTTTLHPQELAESVGEAVRHGATKKSASLSSQSGEE